MLYCGWKTPVKGVDTISETRVRPVLRYLPLLILFLFYLAACILLFTVHEKRAVEERTLLDLQGNVERQCDYFRSVINTRFTTLDSLARFAARQDPLADPDSLTLADAIVSTGAFSRIVIADPSGDGWTNRGASISVGDRAHFQSALSGTRTVSDPLPADDGEVKVFLAVPATDSAGAVVGVVSGSFNIGQLSGFLFSELYEGSGHPLLVTSSGALISTTSTVFSQQYDTFFDYCTSVELLDGASLEQIRQDFASGSSGCFLSRSDGTLRYMVYQSAGLGNGWMMCYTISGREASADYSFIFRDVLCLGIAILIGSLLLLSPILRSALRERRRLLLQAQTDPLTGLLNRSSTRASVNLWLSEPGRQGALLMLDLDNFKSINDVCGHQAGDSVLLLAAGQLRAHFRKSDVIGRIGGDEFMVLMKDVSSPQVAERHMELLCRELRQLRDPAHPQVTISCSVGAALAPAHGHTFQELYSHADLALYQAKHHGKNGWSLFTAQAP